MNEWLERSGNVTEWLKKEILGFTLPYMIVAKTLRWILPSVHPWLQWPRWWYAVPELHLSRFKLLAPNSKKSFVEHSDVVLRNHPKNGDSTNVGCIEVKRRPAFRYLALRARVRKIHQYKVLALQFGTTSTYRHLMTIHVQCRYLARWFSSSVLHP